MKKFNPTFSEQDIGIIVTALDCFVKQAGVQAVQDVARLVALLEASAIEFVPAQEVTA